ncbi:hypothetical protein [Streptomonospora litoralis]|uniref:Uncharacterized protein n=1 Tax=Streptomonospora litoralis TaxID=2498135 RepID=A0A4P6Q6U7_9ACTN|nr:hypothetical protein [Streptomonospora litoralis]QBI56508.1 hypothetical protein EKD16_23810 [Streptomonospora litoralis]
MNNGTSSPAAADPQPPWRTTVGRLLMVAAAVSALVAAAGALPTVLAAGPEQLMAQTWRLYGFLVFAALFGLLALRPLHYRWVWEIVIANKVLLSVTAGAFVLGGQGVVGAAAAAIADGVLSVVVVAAYILCRGWRAGPRRADRTGPGSAAAAA